MKHTNHFIIFLLFIVVTGCGPQPSSYQSLTITPTPTLQTPEDWLKEWVDYENEVEDCKPYPPVGSINISCSFPKYEYIILTEDFEMLRTAEFSGPNSSTLKEVLHLSDTSGATLFHWLEDHIHHILYRTFDLDRVKASKSLAMDYGGYRYNLAQHFKTSSPRVNLPGFGMITIPSPRIGLIRTNDGFLKNEYNRWNARRYEKYRRYSRLATLFHEAVHTTGLDHEECPPNHPYDVGPHSCDRYSNGAYGIEILFLKAVIESCDTCTDLDKVFFKIDIESFQEHLFPENELSIGHGKFE